MTCHATACKQPIATDRFMCVKHWYMLPRYMRLKLWDAFKPGEVDDLDPNRKYCEVARECIVNIARQEGKVPDTEFYDFHLRT